MVLKVLAEEHAALPKGAERMPIREWFPQRFRYLEHDLRLPSTIGHAAPGVFLSPAQHPPRRSPVPWIQILHDVIPLSRPHPLLAADERRWRRIGPRLKSAAAVAAVSRFSADEGIRHFGLDPRAVHVIPNGVDLELFHPADPADAAPPDPPYVLHVSAWGPHKGFDEALQVVAGLAEAGLPHRLIMTGPNDAWMLSQVQDVVARSPRPDRAEIAGYVDDLPATYRSATALLMTSRCEGFGLPALEAMACGTPVVGFANSSLPEVIGEGGVLVPDGDVRAMIAAVERIARGDDLREELRARGIAWAGKFPWRRAVDAYSELVRSVAA